MKIRRILMTLLVLFIGLLPSLLLFIWVERNTALPWLGTFLMTHGLGLPWVFVDAGLAGSIFFNLGLIAIFGVLHSGLAGRKSVSRPVYVIFSGISSLLIILFWQPTGVVLYQLIPSAEVSTAVSILLYWGLLAVAAKSIAGIEGTTSFVGLTSGDSELDSQKFTPPILRTTGFYARVRHPAYFLTAAAWLITPMMGLDRLIFSFGMLAYLMIGIRLEERRLVQTFGEAYRDYQRKTPMLFPTIKIRK